MIYQIITETFLLLLTQPKPWLDTTTFFLLQDKISSILYCWQNLSQLQCGSWRASHMMASRTAVKNYGMTGIILYSPLGLILNVIKPKCMFILMKGLFGINFHFCWGTPLMLHILWKAYHSSVSKKQWLSMSYCHHHMPTIMTSTIPNHVMFVCMHLLPWV